MIVRCDDPSRLTPASLLSVVDHGIRTVIDLRKPQEVAENPNPFTDHDPRLRYINISMVDPAAPERPEVFRLVDNYTDSVDSYGDRIAQVMTEIATAHPGGVLIHCVAGKDRTGLISALLLRLVGVSIDIAAEDYAISQVQLRPFDERWLANGPWHARGARGAICTLGSHRRGDA